MNCLYFVHILNQMSTHSQGPKIKYKDPGDLKSNMVVQPGLIEGHQQWPLAVSAKKFCLIIPSIN